MTLHVVLGLVGTAAALLAGICLFWLLNAFMTGCDLRDRGNMAAFIGGLALIVLFVVVAVASAWSWTFGLNAAGR